MPEVLWGVLFSMSSLTVTVNAGKMVFCMKMFKSTDYIACIISYGKTKISPYESCPCLQLESDI